uniref:Peroxisome biogenesis factor 10 n=1 Tax=Tanacetum cinerariifolium TaxID=118510 RepID=A0A6L2K7X0_TANCI|nr:peroxisome biogenesis factor 10 [Tanacetum cinerariifolium]
MEPPPPHLWVDDYIEHENEGEDDVKDEEALMMATEEAIDEICGSRAVKINLEDVFSERIKDGNGDDFGKRSPIAYNKFLNHGHERGILAEGERSDPCLTGKVAHDRTFMSRHRIELHSLLDINNRSRTAETLGEEYCDITQVSGSYGLPPTPASRALFIVYQSAVPYIAERVSGCRSIGAVGSGHGKCEFITTWPFKLCQCRITGVDYNEWGMDIEEYERREMEPPPPHLWVDDYIERVNDGEDDAKDEEALMMATEEAIDEICGSRAVKIHLENVFSERNKDGNGDDFGKRSPIAYNKFLNHGHGINRLTMLVVVMIVLRFLRRQILNLDHW